MVYKSWNVPQVVEGAHHEKPRNNYPLWGSVRLTYTIYAFFTMMLNVAMRQMLGFIILRMVKPRAEDALLLLTLGRNVSASNEKQQCDSDIAFASIPSVVQSGDLSWTRSQELTFPGSFYYGYVITLAFAGHLSDKLGGKLLLLNSLTWQAVSFIAIPFMAHHSYAAAVATLILTGIFAGCGNPPVYQLFVVWAHPTERTALLSFAFSGIIVGTMLIYPLTNFLSNFGWEMPFYVLGGISLLCGIASHWLIYNSLDAHPRITPEEKLYLQPDQAIHTQKKSNTPWRALLTSMPVYAFIMTHIFHNYGYIVLSLVMPRILNEAMHFDMNEVGVVSSAPYLGSFISKIMCFATCGYVEMRVNSKLNHFRRILYAVCAIVIMCCIGAIINASCKQKILVVVMYMLLGVFSDLSFTGGYWPTLLYFAPSYAGLLSGIANSLAHLSGFVTPQVIAAIMHNGTKSEWDTVLLSLIISYGLAMIVFGSCSSSTLQPWDPRSRKNETSGTMKDNSEKFAVLC